MAATPSEAAGHDHTSTSGTVSSRGPEHPQPNTWSSAVSTGSDHGIVLDFGVGLVRHIVDPDSEAITLVHQHLSHRRSSTSTVVPPKSVLPYSKEHVMSKPPQDLVLHLSRRAFETCYRLSEIVPEYEYQRAVKLVYHLPPSQLHPQDYDGVALLSAIVALAYAVDSLSHSTVGCVAAMEESNVYFRTAASTLERHRNQVTSLTQLRTVVCMILYQLITNTPVATVPLLDIACLAARNLGLCESQSHLNLTGSKDNDEQAYAAQNLLWVIIYLDLYICGLLGRPSFKDSRLSEEATREAIRHSANNTIKYVRTSQQDILRVGLALQIELFRIMKHIARSSPISTREDLLFLKKELDDWAYLADKIFPRDEATKVVARTRYELKTCHCLAVMLLGSPHIRDLEQAREMADPTAIRSATLGQYCIDAAMEAVDDTVEYCKMPDNSPFGEPTAYILFVALLILTTVLEIVPNKDQVMSKLQQGLWLMSKVACPHYLPTMAYRKSTEKFFEDRGFFLDGLIKSGELQEVRDIRLHGQDSSQSEIHLDHR